MPEGGGADINIHIKIIINRIKNLQKSNIELKTYKNQTFFIAMNHLPSWFLCGTYDRDIKSNTSLQHKQTQILSCLGQCTKN